MGHVVPIAILSDFCSWTGSKGLDPPRSFAACIDNYLCTWHTVDHATIDMLKVFWSPDLYCMGNLSEFNRRFVGLIRGGTTKSKHEGRAEKH